MSKLSLWIITLCGFLFFVSCSQEGSDKASDTRFDTTGTGNVDRVGMKEDGVYILPAPLQVATLLKMVNVEYSEKFLVPRKPSGIDYPSNYLQALNLGIYSIDLGYATIYGQRQTSLDYVKHVQKLMTDLGVASGIRFDMAKRFQNNIENQDSLSKIILESFGKAHRYFQDNKREDTGLLILTGSYIEGLYLTLNNKNIMSDEHLQNLLGQQKLFLENIIILLQYYDEKMDVKKIMDILSELRNVFQNIEVINSDTPEKVVIKCLVTKGQLKELLELTDNIRNNIINS